MSKTTAAISSGMGKHITFFYNHVTPSGFLIERRGHSSIILSPLRGFYWNDVDILKQRRGLGGFAGKDFQIWI
jgi:hypothetical protein